MTTKIKLFSDSDLDGVSCGILANIIFAGNVDITYCTPKDVDNIIIDFINSKEYLNYKKIFITDLVIRESTAELINSIGDYKFKLFDHHRSNYVNNKYMWVTVYEAISNVKTCGTELFWNHLKEYYISDNDYSVIDEYVEYVRLWDTWDWTTSGDKGIYAKNLNTVLNIYSKSKFVNNIVNRISECSNEFINPIEYEIIKTEEMRKSRYIKQKMKNIRIHDINGYKIAYVFAENHISELGNYICKNVEGIKFAAIINTDTRVVSLRASSESDVDLAKIAKDFSYQGGGHKLSAGFVFDKFISEMFVGYIFGTINNEPTK